MLIDNEIQIISMEDVTESDPEPGKIVTASGWGLPADGAGATSDYLRDVDVPVLSNEDCNAYYQVITDGHLCTDGKGGHGTCQVLHNTN